MIADAVAKAPPGKYDTDETAESWQARRVKNRRIANRKVSHLKETSTHLVEDILAQGPETWLASKGTEHRST